jgi:hypothetical protein
VQCGIVAGLAFGAVLANDARAQGRANSLRDGAWALQFSIPGDWNLSDFSGGIAIKRHFSPKGALRLSVSGAGNTVSGSSSDELQTRELNTDGYEVSIVATYQRYINPGSAANLFWGVGPFVSLEGSTSDNGETTWEEASRYGVGLSGIIGIEWFATEMISFHSEYVGNGGYTHQESKRTGNTPIESELSGWFLNAGGVQFGLSVYF